MDIWGSVLQIINLASLPNYLNKTRHFVQFIINYLGDYGPHRTLNSICRESTPNPTNILKQYSRACKMVIVGMS